MKKNPSPYHGFRFPAAVIGCAVRWYGGITNDRFVGPTIIDIKDDNASLFLEEIFGPILAVRTVDSFEEAIEVANRSEYGLAASIFTGSVSRALIGAKSLRSGTGTVNAFGEGDTTTPFGGFKSSGFGGRDKGIHAHDQYTQLKTIWIDLAMQ